MSDDKMWALTVIVLIGACCAFFVDACRGEQQSERAKVELNKVCIAAGGDVIDGNCIRRAK